MEAHFDNSKKRRLYVPARYVITGVRVVCVVLSSLQNSCMSIAITSMVKISTSSTTSNNNSSNNNNNNTSAEPSDVCPVSANTASSTQAADKGGEFDWSELTQSYVTNGGTYGGLCTMLIGAYIAQRWSPKLMIAAVTALSALCTVLTPVLAKWNVYALIVSRVLMGFTAGIGMPASGQLESTWFPPDERQQLSGIIMSAMNIGSIVASSLTGVLLENYGWEFLFYAYGGISVISLILWMAFVYDTPQTHPRISDEEREYIARNVQKTTDVRLPVPWVQIALSPPVWAYLAMSVSITWLLFVFMTELPTYLRHMFYYSTSNAGYITSIALAATVSSQLMSGFLSQWLRRKGYIGHLTSYRIFNALTTLGPAATLLAITQVGCNATAVVVLLVMTMFLHGTFISGSMLNHMDLAINFVPSLAALNGTIICVVGIVSPTLAAAIINNNQTLSAWSKVFYISAAMSAVPYIIFFIFGSAEEQPWNKPQFELSKESDKDMGESSSQTKKEKESSTACKVNIS